VASVLWINSDSKLCRSFITSWVFEMCLLGDLVIVSCRSRYSFS
jgi:hypothetical protein